MRCGLSAQRRNSGTLRPKLGYRCRCSEAVPLYRRVRPVVCGVAAMLEALGVLQPAKAVLRFFDFLLYTGGDTTTRARYHLN